MQAWEYKTLPIFGKHISDLETDVAALGQDGWEMIAVMDRTNQVQPIMWFKRPVQG